MTHVLARVAAPIPPRGHADAVDAQLGAVQDHERLADGDLDRLVQRAGLRGQGIEGFADVAERGGGADPEPGGEVGAGRALAQV